MHKNNTHLTANGYNTGDPCPDRSNICDIPWRYSPKVVAYTQAWTQV